MQIPRRTFIELATYAIAAPAIGRRFGFAQAGSTTSGPSVIRERLLRMLAPADAQERQAAESLAKSLGPDGRWPDIDYADLSRSEWKPSSHLVRVLRMAAAYRHVADSGGPDDELKKTIAAALQWWLDHDLHNPNWWHNEIGVPKLLGQTALFLGDALDERQRAGIVNTMKRSNWSRWTGQNLVWGCQIQVMRGLVTHDDQTVRDGYGRLYEEVRIGPPLGEGVMPDFSFHQHGAQLYSGGYGLNFADDVGAFIYFSWGTAYQIPAATMAVYTQYMLDGLAWMTRGRFIDYSCAGREITRKGKAAVPARSRDGALTNIAASFRLDDVAERLASLEVPRRNEFAGFAARLAEKPGAAPLSGNRHFWCSDYMTHQRPEFFASVRMFSSRLLNTEIINDEGKQSHHLADGCTLIYRRGDEYRDIFPVWDWSKIPGTTAEQIDLLAQKSNPRYKTDADFVGGVSDGTYGLAAQELHRESLRARKAWMMFEDGFAALGAGIDCDSSRPVVTSLNQCLQRGEVSGSPEAGAVWHDGLAYVFPGKQNLRLTHGEQTGKWSDIGVGPDRPVSENVFRLWIEHGARPQNATYAYFVFAGGEPAAAARLSKDSGLAILSNSPELQAVRHHALKLTYAVFWNAGRLESGKLTLAVDQPCVLMLREIDGKRQMSVANPRNEALRVNVTIGSSRVTIDLPGGAMAGSSVVRQV